MTGRRGRVPWKAGAVRERYAAGFWDYACGAPAVGHPRYAEAADLMEARGENPWWMRSLVDVDAVLEGCRFDEAAGMLWVEAIEASVVQTLGEWAGQPMTLFDWQIYDIVAPLFGWKRPDGFRRYRKAAIWVPKKVGKSTLAAALALMMLIIEGDEGAEIVCAANAVKQADIVHKQARDFVKRSPALRELLRVFDSTKRIVRRDQYGVESVFHAISSEAGIQEGLNWSMCLIDELHSAEKDDLYNTLEEGGIARRQSLLLSISTAGVYNPKKIGWVIWSYCNQVRSGMVRDTSFFARTYAADERDDAGDERETWYKANPSLGLTVRADDMRATYIKAKAEPSLMPSFLRYRLNLWVQSAQEWIAPSAWIEIAEQRPEPCRLGPEGLTLSAYAEALRGRRCYGGMDLSQSRDMTAGTLVFPPTRDDEHWRAIWYYQLPGQDLEKLASKSKAPYSAWAHQGWLYLNDGNVIDEEAIRRWFLGASKVFDIHEIAFDRYKALGIVTRMKDTDGLPMVEFGQGFGYMSPAIGELEKLILGKRLRHEGNPIAAWNLANAVLRTNANQDRRWDRSNENQKIDGLVTLTMAVGRAAAHADKDRKVSVYETRGAVWA